MIATNGWAKDEMKGLDLNDRRLNARLELLLNVLDKRPNLSLPAALGGRAELEAAYRFFDNKKVTFDKILAPHVSKTIWRASKKKVVLLVQDTTEIDLTRPELRVAGTGELDGSRNGFLSHVMHVFTPKGVPQGTVWAQNIVRTEGVSHDSAEEKRRQLQQTPIEEKESMRWLDGLRRARDVAAQMPNTLTICVGDSEADIYELFAEPRGETIPVHFLIRACRNRALSVGPDGSREGNETQKLFEAVRSQPVQYHTKVRVRGRKAKISSEKRSRRQSREDRKARVVVRCARVTLRPPTRPGRKLWPVEVNVVMVTEPNPPPGEPAIEWILVTTLPIDRQRDLKKIIDYYRARWNIEVLFKVLKSGCRIEERRLEHIDRMLACLAVYLIIAWRTLMACRLSDECPDLSCEVIYTQSEWKSVWVVVTGTRPPKTPPRLGKMVRMIATLGGFIDRPDCRPGPQTVWIGHQRMYDFALAWDRFGPAGVVKLP